MTTLFRRLAAALIVTMGASLPAAAATNTIDYTDLWYNAPAESQSGWGVNVIQQNNTIFATMFVFGSDNTPRWYVASNVLFTGGTTFTGALYSVGTGTWFGAPWAGISNVQQVGNIAFTFNSVTTGTLVYSVNNVQVTKQIVRQSTVYDNLAGNYIGGLVGSGSNCGSTGILIHGELTVQHTGANVNMTTNFFNGNGQAGTCTYTGAYAQIGSMGQVSNGSYNCTIAGQANALVGTFTLAEIKMTRNGFTSRISGTDNACTYTGYFGGIKDVL
jgi:hypothetical protein